MKILYAVFFALLLLGCTAGPPPAAPPPEGPGTCETACANLRTYKCAVGNPTPKGAVCEAVCTNSRNNGVAWQLGCLSATRSCENCGQLLGLPGSRDASRPGQMFAKALAFWLYGLMCWLLPLSRGVELSRLDPASQETVEERDTRYHGIADAIAEVVTDPRVTLPFLGPSGPAKTAGYLLAVSYKESAWRKDVDVGIGKASRGGGMDSCLTQIRVGSGTTAEGWTHEDLTTDRTKCFRAALRLMRRSLGACQALLEDERLAAYAAGTCQSRPGQEKSRSRVRLAKRLFGRGKLPAPFEEPTASAADLE